MPTHPLATRRGKAFRLAILTRDLWLCQMCGCLLSEGKKKPNTAAVDHIRPIELRPDLTWDEDNCRAVCRRCHATCDAIEKRASGDAEMIAQRKLAYRPVGLDGYKSL